MRCRLLGVRSGLGVRRGGARVGAHASLVAWVHAQGQRHLRSVHELCWAFDRGAFCPPLAWPVIEGGAASRSMDNFPRLLIVLVLEDLSKAAAPERRIRRRPTAVPGYGAGQAPSPRRRGRATVGARPYNGSAPMSPAPPPAREEARREPNRARSRRGGGGEVTRGDARRRGGVDRRRDERARRGGAARVVAPARSATCERIVNSKPAASAVRSCCALTAATQRASTVRERGPDYQER